jgi:hypothetical protein
MCLQRIRGVQNLRLGIGDNVSVASDHVAFFRTQRADRYIDTITITDLTSRGTFNRTTKQFDSESTSTVYTGGALIRPKSAAARERGEQGEVLYTHIVHVPYDTDGVTVGNTITVTTSVYDADLTGAVLTIQDHSGDSYMTHRELKCLLSQGGGDRG